MRKIFAILAHDLRQLRGNAIALLVIMGLAIMPSFYAWFNIAGGWDPYGNSGQVKVALANSDEGVKGSVVPFNVNVGERVVTSLTGSTKIGYVVTDEEDAVDGVRSGEYYAAVVIPKNFSTNLLSVLTKTPEHPQLDYYVNEKRNAIASIVTGKASGSVQTMVNEGFTEAVTEVATELFDEVSGLVHNDDMAALGSNLNGALGSALTALERTASDITAYKNVIASIRGVMRSATPVLGSDSASLDVAGSLSDAANGVRTLDEVAARAKDAANSAIDAGKSSVDDVRAALDEAFALAGDKTDELTSALQRVNDVAKTRRDELVEFRTKLEGLNGELVSREESFRSISAAVHVETDISELLARVDNGTDYLNELIDSVDRTISDVQTTKTNAQTSRSELQGLAESAQAAIESARASYDGSLSGSLDDLANKIDAAAVKSTEVADSLRAESEKVSTAIAEADGDLQSLEEALDAASAKLDKVVEKVTGLRDKLSSALSSGDMDLVRSIMGGDASSLASFLSAPVELDREAFFPVENNGSAMTPFYTTMALWVGGTLMGLIIYVGISKKTEEEVGAAPRHAYLGRLAFFLLVGACQATILLLGDLFFLRVQCENPLLFLLTGWLASTVFINIIYSLATSFGDVGKAIAVFIMVLQVAGSGGTFPVQMLPPLFQKAYPFLPFVHSENAFRAAMFGVYDNDWAMEMGILAAFLIPALLLGLVLRKPFVRANEWIEEKMEETKLM
ncbi:MAG: YhgE/Pip domain-containing protein [Atopobiaceae bacterium]|nr:YhgE/Pip domain-containing protein [Atopobiaceae bacterium]